MPISVTRLKATDKEMEIDGHRCVSVEPKSKSNLMIDFAYWVDPKAAFIMRCFTLEGNGVREQVDISYSYHDELRTWLPAGWTIAKTNSNGDPISHTTATVTSGAINLPVEDDVFVLEFPPGTRVSDATKKAGSKDKYYLVREGGDKRSITRDELRLASYDQTVATESGRALEDSNERGSFFWFRMGAVVLVLSLVFFTLMRRKSA